VVESWVLFLFSSRTVLLCNTLEKNKERRLNCTAHITLLESKIAVEISLKIVPLFGSGNTNSGSGSDPELRPVTKFSLMGLLEDFPQAAKVNRKSTLLSLKGKW
jgi:hypothetical protein